MGTEREDIQCLLLVQAAFVRVHQDFTANVLRGGKPHIAKDVREELEGQELSLEEFKHWSALVRHPLLLSCHAYSRHACNSGTPSTSSMRGSLVASLQVCKHRLPLPSNPCCSALSNPQIDISEVLRKTGRCSTSVYMHHLRGIL